jgi:AcrR family transcriptional regulator
MRRRRELVDRTRQRITEAAVRLHTSVGPSRTSMSAVADAAGVTRLTLYRHFPDGDTLFQACMGHWRTTHPPPDPERWRAMSEFEPRVRTALRELYGWYARNGDELYPIYRDAAFTPPSNQEARRQTNAVLTNALVDALPGNASPSMRRRVRAAIGHAVGFWTWRSLAVEQRLSTREAVAMAVDLVLSSVHGRQTASR